MKKSLVILGLVAAASLSGCATGPSYLSRSWDDYTNKAYVESPLATGVLTDVLPIYPLVGFIAAIPDWLVLNPVQFWGTDVWDGKGAAFTHENPEGEAKTLWFDK